MSDVTRALLHESYVMVGCVAKRHLRKSLSLRDPPFFSCRSRFQGWRERLSILISRGASWPTSRRESCANYRACSFERYFIAVAASFGQAPRSPAQMFAMFGQIDENKIRDNPGIGNPSGFTDLSDNGAESSPRKHLLPPS
jgi:hypothetical protein